MGIGSDTPPSRDKLAPTRGAGLSGDSFLVQTSIVGASFSALAALPFSVHLKIT